MARNFSSPKPASPPGHSRICDLNVEVRPVSDLDVRTQNPRTHSIDEENRVVAGPGRHEAAKMLGMDQPRAWSTRGRGRAETDTLAQAIPKRTRCSSHAIGRRVSPASFFAVSSSGWRSRRMVFTTSGARKLSRRMRVK